MLWNLIINRSRSIERCDDYRRKQSINVNQPDLGIVIHGYREALCWLHHSYKFFSVWQRVHFASSAQVSRSVTAQCKKIFGNKWLSFFIFISILSVYYELISPSSTITITTTTTTTTTTITTTTTTTTTTITTTTTTTTTTTLLEHVKNFSFEDFPLIGTKFFDLLKQLLVLKKKYIILSLNYIIKKR